MMDYEGVVAQAPTGDYDSLVAFLCERLPLAWLVGYKRMTPHATNTIEIVLEHFTYWFDHVGELEQLGMIPQDTVREGRLVVAFGLTATPSRRRESARMRGWIGPTEYYFGGDRDKGHFIAHSIGGRVDGFEINLFAQARPVNRGWSALGKRYRAMEVYAANHPGTFCFSRPVYTDQTSAPAAIEFGILMRDRHLWVETFDNTSTISRLRCGKPPV